MYLHFYTPFESIRMIRSGKKTQVWTKKAAVDSDIHISIDPYKYHVEKISDTLYDVTLKQFL